MLPLLFKCFFAFGILIFGRPIWQIGNLSLENELYSHFLLIPMVSLFLLWTERRYWSRQHNASVGIGMLVMVVALICYLVAIQSQEKLNNNDYLSLCLLSSVIWIHGGFIGIYGFGAYRRSLFPMFFLMLCIPIPTFVLAPSIQFLQVWSAHAVQLAFDIVGIPYLREGMMFQLPGIAIEVAEQCSGMRSSLALVITSILAGHLFLQTTWRKVALILITVPLTIFKNAVRITTLSLLAVYIDHSWLTHSWLHRGGGIVFFLLTLFLLAPVIWGLAFSEKGRKTSEKSGILVEKSSSLRSGIF